MSGLGTSNISVVIPTKGKRLMELMKIRKHLEDFGFEDIIIAEDDERMLMTRYDATEIAKNDIIYTQDDDCIVNNIQEIIDNYEPNTIVANSKIERINYYQRKCDGKICLVGYGAIFDRKLCDNMVEYFQRFGTDELSLREADRIFTWFNRKKLVIADIDEYPSSMNGLSNKDGHEQILDIIIGRLKMV